MIYLITGAAGHLGSVIVKDLIKKKKQVRALVLPNEKHAPKDVELYYGDICDKESIRECFENLNGKKMIVIHCAGIVSITSKFNQKVYDVNVNGTKNIVDLCKEYNVLKLIYVSSVHALPELKNNKVITEITKFNAEEVIGLYAKTKSEASAYVMEAVKQGLNACIVHPSGIIGPYDYGNGHLTTLIIDYYKGRLPAGVNGGYDFVDVRDVANGIILICDKGICGECYILSNKYFKVEEILTLLHDISGKKKVSIYLPIWFIKIIAPLTEFYYKMLNQTPLFTPYSIYTLSSNANFSHKKATKELGYKTRDMKDTITDTITWLKEKERI